MKFIELNKNLKIEVKNVYNIVGDDLFLVRQAITNLKAFLIKDMEEFNYTKVDADKMKPTEVEVLMSGLPLGNDYRLVVLNQPNADVVKFLNKYDFDNQLVVICLNADKLTVGEIIDCSKLDRADIVKYVLNYLSKCKLSIEEQALDYIIQATDSNMSHIVNELNKVVSFAKDQEVITIEMVLNLITNNTEYAIYMLTAAIDKKDMTEYQKILNDISKTLSLAEIYAFMGKYFKRMQYIALNKDDNGLAEVLGIKPYAVKMSRQFVDKNGIKFYIELYQKYVELDYKVKSGKISVKNALYELVF